MVFPEVRQNVVVPNAQVDGQPKQIITGSENPTVDGVRGAIGDLFLRNNGELYQKTGAANTGWTLVGGGGGGGLLYYTTVVGNSTEGDTVTDVDFLDPGDGSGIAAAIAALPVQGGTILVRKGVYNLTAAIAIDRSNIRIIGEGAGSTVINLAVDTDGFTLGSAAAARSDVEIGGMTFNENAGTTATGNAAIFGDRVSNVYVHDCEFNGKPAGVIDGLIGVGLVDSTLAGISNILVENNRFTGAATLRIIGAKGLLGQVALLDATNVQVVDNQFSIVGNVGSFGCTDCESLTIGNNLFDGTFGGGGSIITVGSTVDATVQGNVMNVSSAGFVVQYTGTTTGSISGNTSTISAGSHFQVTAGARATVSANYLEGGGSAVSLVGSTDSAITGNTIISTGAIGITVDATSSRFAVTGNYVSDNTLRNIIYSGSDGIVSGNTCTNPTTTPNACIESTGSPTDVTVNGNHCSGATVGIDFTPSGGGDITITGNTVDGNTTGILSDKDRILIEGNTVTNNTTGISISGDDCQVQNNHGTGNTTDVADTGSRNYFEGNWFQLPFVQTPDDTPVILFSFTLPGNGTWVFDANVSARDTSGTDHAGYTFTAMVSSEAGVATLGGASPQADFTDESAGAAAWNATFTVAANDMQVTITGDAVRAVDWAARVSWRGL